MIDTHPKFSANQVLKHKHLNGLFDYLDEQNRLSRTHLIGLGIVCGLEIGEGVGDQGRGLTISRGCGVSSEGHLLHWDNDDVLEYYRPYTIPDEVNDRFFTTYAGEVSNQVKLWELGAESDGDDEFVALSENFLKGAGFAEDDPEGGEKVLLLFLECKETDDENCGPNDCDDKGANVVLTLRPLLARAADIEAIRDRLIDNNDGAREYFALDVSRARQLALPTMRMPRFDVPNSRPATSYDLLKAYETALSEDFLERMEVGLEAVYVTLSPIAPGVPVAPFSNFASVHAFLHDGRMLGSEQAIFFQQWFDHIRTIQQAYAELKDRAEALYALCCPDDQVFPRHLSLGTFSAAGEITDRYRHYWIASPVNGAAGEARDELRSLFLRLYRLLTEVSLVQPPRKQKKAGGAKDLALLQALAGKVANARPKEFALEASAVRAEAMLAARAGKAFVAKVGKSESSLSAKERKNLEALSTSYDRQLKMMDKSLIGVMKGKKRFPFERDLVVEKGDPEDRPSEFPIRITPSHLHQPLSERSLPAWYEPEPLLEVWNFRRTRRGRSRETLGYRAPEYNLSDPAVRSPLNFELEPRDFLRVEGITGLEDVEVMRELSRQVARYRLPIDLVNVRTGGLDETMNFDDYEILFADLEAQYQSGRERLLSRLAEVASRLYDVRILDDDGRADAHVRVFSSSRSLFNYLPDYKYSDGTVGKIFEDSQGSPQAFFASGLWYYISTAEILVKIFALADALPETLDAVDWSELEAVFLDSEDRIRDKTQYLALRLNDPQTSGPQDFRRNHLDVEEVADQLDLLLDGGDRAAFGKLVELRDERRQEILKRKVFFSFQEQHPGLRYKAGTELGGTFVVVSHGDAEPVRIAGDGKGFRVQGRLEAAGRRIREELIMIPREGRQSYIIRDGKFNVWVKRLPARVEVHRRGARGLELVKTITLFSTDFQVVDLVRDQTPTDEPLIPGLEPGTVIANFYLPYRCCAKGNPVVINPPAPPEPPAEPLRVSLKQSSCTKVIEAVDGGRVAEMAITVTGGVPPYRLSIDEAASELPAGPIAINSVQAFAVLDAKDTAVPLLPVFEAPLRAELRGKPTCSDDRKDALYTVAISGGKPPYHYFNADGVKVTVAAGQDTVMAFPAGTDDPEVMIMDEWGDSCGFPLVLPIHDCPADEAKCELPCEGALLQTARYPMWLQRPRSNKHFLRINDLVVEELFLCLESGDGEECKQR